MSFRFVIACEDRMQFEVVRRIAERHLVAELAWLSDVIDDTTWHRETVTSASKRAHDGSVRVRRLHGHFGGVPGEPDALMLRAQLQLWLVAGWPFDFAVIARDSDGDDRRRVGATQALTEHCPPKPVVLAYAEPEIEAWVIAGFDPLDDAERTNLARLRDRLGFDLQQMPERLTSKRQTDARDAKRALGELCEDADAAHRRCTDVDQDTWVARTRHAGGGAFVSGLATVPPHLRTG